MLRYYLLIVTAVLLILHSSAEGKAASISPQKPPANNATQTSPSSLAPDLKRIAGALEAEARKPPSDYERRNVEAQERVAAWTPWIAIVATLEMFITAAGVILVGFTLYHTKRAADASRDAADEAKRASNAAEKSIKVARDVGRAQVRAYLGFDVISGDIAPGRPIKFHVRATNHGQSPAIDVAIASCVVVRQLNWEWEDEEKIPEGQFPRITIHPNGFYDTFPEVFPPVVMTEQLISALREEQSCIFCRVTVFSKDVFKVNWRTQVCFEFSGDYCFNSGKARIAPRGNYMKRINKIPDDKRA